MTCTTSARAHRRCCSPPSRPDRIARRNDRSTAQLATQTLRTPSEAAAAQGGGVGGNETISAVTTPTTLAYRDLRWEVTGASIPGIIPNVYMPWKPFAAAIVAALPNHRVRAGFLLDGESCQFAPSGVTCGKAYYNLVTIENRTLEIWQDTVKK